MNPENDVRIDGQSMTTDSDADGDFERLYREHYAAVHGFVGRRLRPDLVDDTTQEVFLVAWRRRTTVDKPGIGWLLGIARNLVAERYRSGSRLRDITEAATNMARTNQPTPGGADEVVIERHTVLSALAQLALADQEVLMLTAWEDLSPTEVAESLGCAVTTYRMRLSRARSRFEEAIAVIERTAENSPASADHSASA